MLSMFHMLDMLGMPYMLYVVCYMRCGECKIIDAWRDPEYIITHSKYDLGVFGRPLVQQSVARKKWASASLRNNQHLGAAWLVLGALWHPQGFEGSFCFSSFKEKPHRNKKVRPNKRVLESIVVDWFLMRKGEA